MFITIRNFAGMADFKKLKVWQSSHQLTLNAFKACEPIKGSTPSVVRDQLLRAAMSIGSNIAEGSSKRSDRDFARYVRISLGSSTELENHLLLAGDLGLISRDEFEKLNKELEEVRKMLTGLEKRLSADADRVVAPSRRK